MSRRPSSDCTKYKASQKLCEEHKDRCYWRRAWRSEKGPTGSFMPATCVIKPSARKKEEDAAGATPSQVAEDVDWVEVADTQADRLRTWLERHVGSGAPRPNDRDFEKAKGSVRTVIVSLQGAALQEANEGNDEEAKGFLQWASLARNLFRELSRQQAKGNAARLENAQQQAEWIAQGVREIADERAEEEEDEEEGEEEEEEDEEEELEEGEEGQVQLITALPPQSPAQMAAAQQALAEGVQALGALQGLADEAAELRARKEALGTRTQGYGALQRAKQLYETWLLQLAEVLDADEGNVELDLNFLAQLENDLPSSATGAFQEMKGEWESAKRPARIPLESLLDEDDAMALRQGVHEILVRRGLEVAPTVVQQQAALRIPPPPILTSPVVIPRQMMVPPMMASQPMMIPSMMPPLAAMPSVVLPPIPVSPPPPPTLPAAYLPRRKALHGAQLDWVKRFQKRVQAVQNLPRGERGGVAQEQPQHRAAMANRWTKGNSDMFAEVPFTQDPAFGPSSRAIVDRLREGNNLLIRKTGKSEDRALLLRELATYLGQAP